MDTRKELREIEEYFGQGWFEEFTVANKEIAELPLEEQITMVRSTSIHGQTFFFRDNRVLGVLEHIVLPSYRKTPVLMASIGCSDGREVYSILIANWKRREQLRIHGFDSNPDFIEEARGGNSRAYHEENCKLNEWDRFGARGEAYTVTPRRVSDWSDVAFTDEAKKYVQFEVHDIMRGHLPKKYEIILMLNVLCHYTPNGREQILWNVSSSLNESGWLVCESYNYGSVNAKKEYDTWMKDFSRLGFVKQRTVMPTWYDNQDDVSCWSRVYRKI